MPNASTFDKVKGTDKREKKQILFGFFKNNRTFASCMRKIILWLCVGLLLMACGGNHRMEQMDELTEKMLAEDSQQVVFTSDSIPLLLVDYYMLHGTDNQLMRAYYLLGRSYDCRDNHIMALRFYQEAKDKADTTAADIDYTTLSCAYAHSAKIYSTQFEGRPTLALEDGRKALHYAQLAKSEHMVKICHCLLANYFLNMGRCDSVRKYDPAFYENCYHPWAERRMRYIYHYREFVKINHQDDYMGQMVKEFFPMPEDSIPVNFRKQYKNHLSAVYFHAIEKPTDRDSILALSNLTPYINAKLHQQQILGRQQLILIVFVILLLSMLVVGYLLYRFQRQKNKEYIKNLNTKYSLSLSEYQRAKAEMAELKRDVSSKEEEIAVKQLQLDELTQQLAQQQEDKRLPSEWNLLTEVMNAPIISALHRKASIGLKADSKDLRELMKTTKQYVPDFIAALLRQDPKLDDNSLLFCALIKLRFLSSELAILFDKSSQSITNKKVRLLKRIFQIDGGAKQFDAKIHQM